MLMRLPGHGVLLDEPALGQDEAHKAILLRLLAAPTPAPGTWWSIPRTTWSWQPRRMSWSYWGREGIAAQGPAAQVMRMDAAWQRLGFVLPEWVRAKWCA